MSFHLDIITPEKKIYSDEAKKLIIPAITGQLTILSHHTPLFTILKEGEVIYIDNNNKKNNLAIGKGMIEIKRNMVVVLVEPPESSDKIAWLKSKQVQEKTKYIDKDKIKVKGKIATEDAFRRSFLDFKDVKRKKKTSNIPQYNK